jgi:hypothetical protein
MAIELGNNDIVLKLENQDVQAAYLGSTLVYTPPATSLVSDGLVFDFRAEDYTSGSLIWTSNVGNYTASVTGTVGGGLNYIDGERVGFDGNHWLQFNNATTASISSSQWQVYALVEFTNAQTASSAYKPAFFSKGGGNAPSWNWYYQGSTGTTGGWAYLNGYVSFPSFELGSVFLDSFNRAFSGNTKQLFAFQISGSNAGLSTRPILTANASTTIPGNSLANEPFVYGLNSFTGSAAEPLLFGKSFNGDTNTLSGSVVRLFAYNRILSSTERRENWRYLKI